jgi:signal transduction histidine kinase/CheY-like chemotaxis protein
MHNHDSQFRTIARTGSIFLILLGATVLLGWLFDISLLKSILPGHISMKANTAIGFVCCGAALSLSLRANSPSSGKLRYPITLLSLITLAIGLFSLAEYLFHRDLKIDQFFFIDRVQLIYPGRIAHITALNFCAVGIALLLLSRGTRALKLAQLLASFVGLAALLAIIGYLYGVPLLYGSSHYAAMGLHTGIGFLVLSISILAYSPHQGFMAVLTTARPAGWLARKLLIAAVIFPFVLGLVAIRTFTLIGDMRFMVAGLVIAQVLLFAGLIWISASRLDRSEAEEEVAKEALAASERMLQQSQKMEAIGLLAGGVAHDFNNLLNVILGYSELLLSDAGISETQRRKIEKIRKAGETAGGLTRQLLAFGRKQVLQPKALDLNQIINNPDGFLHRLIKDDISFSTSLYPGLMAILADPVQVEQILLNLVINACDAMPNGGKLYIETENVVVEQSMAPKLGVIPGPFVRLTITDTGIGMDDETRSHIFEPFYTTKAVGKGSGLGLATVYGIIKQSGGCIEVDSKLGRGASFQIYLPATPLTISREMPKPIFVHSSSGATILVVEDSEPLRDLIFEALETMGYTALLAQDGHQAIRICAQFTGTIDLLLTDIMMPKMKGPEVMKRVKEMRPDVGVLFMSGYTDDVPLRNGISNADVSFIQKPFSSTELTHKLREALARAQDRNTLRQRLGLEMQRRAASMRVENS